MDVSATICYQAFAPGRKNQSKKGPSQGPGETRAYRCRTSSPPPCSIPGVQIDLIVVPALVVFRDQVYKHLEAIPQGDYDAVASKLIQAGSTLEFLKYADALFDILFIGGLLQPGGLYLDAEGPTSPFSLFQIKATAEPDEIKKFVEVLNKLIRR